MISVMTIAMGYLLCSVRGFSAPSNSRALQRISSRTRAAQRLVGVSGFSASRRRWLSATKEEDQVERSSQNQQATKSNYVNGQNNDKSKGRFDNLLSSVGLAGKLKHIADLPEVRAVTPNDIFCNREVNMERIKCIGFDMDFTLAQYQQPAFDKLAFDGAKEKLVEKLGYPKEVLDFEYDHNVSNTVACRPSQLN